MHRNSRRSTLAIGVVSLAAIALTGCASGSDDAAPAASAAGALDLSVNCPANVVIQTDWNPEAEHGHLYQLLGADPVIDAENKSVSGDLVYDGEPTGVTVEIRSGGPAIGFQTVTSQMYQDTDITLGYVTTDEAVQLSDSLPTTAVFAPLDISPIMLMWDPATYPDVDDAASLGTALEESGGVVRYFGGSAYMEYLIGAGILPASVTDGSYDGTPASFVASGGTDAQQGFASAEPYFYLNEVADWAKPVDYTLVNDAGYPIYASAISVRSAEMEDLSACLTDLVPVLQQASVDYLADPATVNDLIIDLVDQFDTGWVYPAAMADYSVETMQELGLVGNGDNAYLGDMDEERIQTIIDLSTPIFTESGSAPMDGLTPADIATNEFLDDTIGL